MTRYTDEEFVKRMASFRRQRTMMLVLSPLSALVAVLKAVNGAGWFAIVSFAALAVLFAFSAFVLNPRRIRALEAAQRTD